MPDRLTQLLKLHEGDSSDPFLTYGIALEHGKAGRLEDALAWLDKTLSLDANYCYAYFQKAKLLLEHGDEPAARTTLNAGLRAAQQSGDEHAKSELGQLLASLD